MSSERGYASPVTLVRNISVCLLAAVLIFLREPRYFTQPRFWAEEATVYFYTAYRQGFWAAMISVHQGYYSLLANLAGVLSDLLPLQHAPVASTAVALGVQILVVCMVLLNDFLFESHLKKLVASFAVLIFGAFGDLWLASVNSQHYFPLMLFLIFVDNKECPRKRKYYYGIAVMAGLSSIAANFLAPLFLAGYYLRRNPPDRVISLLLVATSALQAGAIAYSRLVLGDAAYFLPYQAQSRFHSAEGLPGVMRAIYYYAFEYPVAGPWREPPFWLGILLIGIMAYALRKDLERYWGFVAAILLLTSLSVISSMDMTGGGRYAYSGTLILVFLLSDLAFRKDLGAAARIVPAILLVVSTGIWWQNYRHGLEYFNDPRWPVWSEEVREWRNNPARVLRAHPQWETQTEAGIVWSVDLSGQGSAFQKD